MRDKRTSKKCKKTLTKKEEPVQLEMKETEVIEA